MRQKSKIKTRKREKPRLFADNGDNLLTDSPMRQSAPPLDLYDFAEKSQCIATSSKHRAGVLAAVAGYLKTHRTPQVRKQRGGDTHIRPFIAVKTNLVRFYRVIYEG